jgi:hypothetical protein
VDFDLRAGLLFLFGGIAFWIVSVGFVVANLFHIVCLRVYRLKEFFPHAWLLGCYCGFALFAIAGGVFAYPDPFLLFTPIVPILHFIALRLRWGSYLEMGVGFFETETGFLD